MNIQAKSKNTKFSKIHIFIILFSMICLLLIYDASGFGGNIRFYSKWAECNAKPLMSGSKYKSGVPFYGVSPSLSLMRMSPTYFCTPHEAELAGYSANPNRYEFPNLNKEEEERVSAQILKDRGINLDDDSN